jgi:hypothetical protein
VDARETFAAFADELDTTDDTRHLRIAIGASTPPLPQTASSCDVRRVGRSASPIDAGR